MLSSASFFLVLVMIIVSWRVVSHHLFLVMFSLWCRDCRSFHFSFDVVHNLVSFCFSSFICWRVNLSSGSFFSFDVVLKFMPCCYFHHFFISCHILSLCVCRFCRSLFSFRDVVYSFAQWCFSSVVVVVSCVACCVVVTAVSGMMSQISGCPGQ